MPCVRALVATLALAAAPLAALLLTSGAAHALPTFDAVRAAHEPSDLPLLDRHGVAIQMVRVDDAVRRGPWVALEDISPALRTAIVLGEDRRYWDHDGIDWRALAASAWANAWNRRTRGASTLTMQLAGLTDDELARPVGGRSLAAKVAQIVRAAQFDRAWTKSQILEAYLNRVPLRGEIVGVAAAANVFFGKQPSGLDAVEAALLAAMVRAPNAAPAAIERRACEVLNLQRLDCLGVGTTLARSLARRPGPLLGETGEAIVPHLARRIAAERDPRSRGPLRSTLDASLQRVALASLRRQLAELRGRDVEDGAVVVIDNASGDVLAWVGSSGPISSSASAVDAVLARRQPGSTVKPFVYGQALQRRLITAASLLDDAPLQLNAAANALYLPQNYDHGYKGLVPARLALASSLNVPAVRVGAMLGPDAMFEVLTRAGLRPSESGGYHGYALALGSAETTLLDLTNAYRMLANGGLWSAPRWRPDAAVAAPHRVFDPAVAWIVEDILADPAARAVTFGLDSPLVTRGWAAVKTGTSKDMRDNWCIGSSDRVTVGVWVGNASGAPMHTVSGVSGAAPVWRELMLQIDAGAPSHAPPPLPGLVAQNGAWFIAGTEPGRLAGGAVRPFGIQAPRDGSLIVLDPEIPKSAQQLVFEGAPGRWRVDGRAVGDGARVYWLPRPGRHRLEWRAADGGAVDAVDFEVRAAPVRPG
ncbi:MAG: penicillin-binding protein 1C [Burkholderiales bacterium]|nr:penicillin-binding protein 1C [Burkholderiales bacterium]